MVIKIDATTLFKGSVINLVVSNMLKGIIDQTYRVTSLPTDIVHFQHNIDLVYTKKASSVLDMAPQHYKLFFYLFFRPNYLINKYKKLNKLS